MSYRIEEIDGEQHADTIRRFNALAPDTFPVLTERHLAEGHWWLVYHEEVNGPVAFAGMVPFFESDDGIGYMKRAYVMPDHRSRGLQLILLTAREVRARQIGWRLLVSECADDNRASACSFFRAGFAQFEPDQKWGAAPESSIYWRKVL